MTNNKLIYVTDIINRGKKGHRGLDFLDIAVNSDNPWFIDPILMENTAGAWFEEATESMNSFFDELYIAYRKDDQDKKRALLSHANEQNGTKLGYGRGDNGKGNTTEGLLNIFSPLVVLSKDINSIKKPSDIPVMVPGFAEDGLSDMITNILHENLNKYTTGQLRKYGKENNTTLTFWTWDKEERNWKQVTRTAFLYEGKELILVPKKIVRRNYMFSTDQFFRRIILERLRKEEKYIFDGKPIPKNDIIKQKRYSGEHWEYKETIDYTREHEDALEEYHCQLPFFYKESGGILTDEDLDNSLYQ